MSKPANENQNSGTKSIVIAALAAVLVLIIGILFIFRPASEEPVEAATQPRDAVRTTSIDGSIPGRAIPGQLNEEGHIEPYMPTSYLVDDFRDPEKTWTNYKLNNLKMTEAGIVLAGMNSDGNSPCEGLLESPPLVLVHPSSTLAPIWRVDAPETAEFVVEVALSPDNQNWSPWFFIEEMEYAPEEFFPDGTPNPNFGAMAGDPIGTGLQLSSFVKYRVKFISHDCGQSPVMQEFKVFHTDSTLGEGYPADDYGDDPLAEAAQESGDQIPGEETTNEAAIN